MVSSIEKRLATLEAELATTRSPKLIFCWTKSLAMRIGKALPGYITVSIHGIAGCADDDAMEAKLREDPVEAERLDRLLAGIPLG
jgi:hypothetical protein